ncbi:hypothetical protein BGW36DRAFT_433776 [Talaromyces proteolyticus]|uniref:Uncharacterized protein n=1 Tax=Talaromyces proteolyticus TaxID=1131652 RepID=A0AAD4PU84_9EURO|nr:uncharacterized protein BGW36DRAFT_433776 [Talaromyces proteolyticus]KAH8689013.1 hypothetical protein BGW36DRAFT_433776 [Talaromyces proteolyticus]
MPSITHDVNRTLDNITRLSGLPVGLEPRDLQRQADPNPTIPYMHFAPVGSTVSLRKGLDSATETTAGGAPRQPVNHYGTIRCAYPSEIAHTRMMSEMRDNRAVIRKQINVLNERDENLQPPEQTAPRNQVMNTLKFINDNLAQSYDYLNNVDCNIGELLVTSDIGNHRGHHLDWALVSLREDRFLADAANMVPNILTRTETTIQLRDWVDEPLGGNKVHKAKYGNHIEGVINPPLSYVRFKNSDGTAYRTTERAIVPSMPYKVFSELGDSGTWVIHRLANALVGVIWGGNTRLGISYITPIKHITDDITRNTGCRVQLPNGKEI